MPPEFTPIITEANIGGNTGLVTGGNTGVITGGNTGYHICIFLGHNVLPLHKSCAETAHSAPKKYCQDRFVPFAHFEKKDILFIFQTDT